MFSRCACCFSELNTIKLTEKDVQHIKELICDELNTQAESICSFCQAKLSDCVSFKHEIVKTQRKFLQQTKIIKSEPESKENNDDDVNRFDDEEIKQEINEEEEENFDLFPIEPFTIIQEDYHSEKYYHETKRKSKSSPKKGQQKLRTSTSSVEKKRRRRKRKDTPSEKDHYCPVCAKFFTEARKVKEHVKRVHMKRKDFHCDMCDYSAYKKYDIFLHITNIHRPKKNLEKNAMCPTCGESFLTNSRLNIHIRRKHLKAIMRKIMCDLCGHKTATLNELRCHMKVHFAKELRERYKCEYCDSFFYSRGSLKTHRDVKHLFTEDNIITCFCGKVFKQKSVYQRHYDVIHLGQKHFKCSECSKAFSGKTHLEYHKRAAHLDIVPSIPCEICGTLYKSIETLKRHMIYHGEPKYKCLECGKLFHENKKLLDHQSFHKTLQYPCQFCDRSFRLETQFNYHLKKVHFKEKLTFKCELCSSSFTRKSTYRDHAMRQHKELSSTQMTEFLKRIKKSLAEEHKNN